MAQALFILNGSNLNMLGTREPAVYGTTTLTEIEKSSKQLAESLGLECDFRQTNHEGILVDWIQEAAIKDAHLDCIKQQVSQGAHNITLDIV